KEVLVKIRVPSILKACRDNPATGGHFGREKTFRKISQRYYWEGMKNDVQEYVKSLNPIPVPAKIWSLVGIDIIGPLQETTSGNKYIVAITDHFSKWSEAAAIPDKSAKSVAQFLYSVVCRLGCMDSLISDQGREFVNKVIDLLMDRFQTDHRIASAYHPQPNGQRERDNRTLKAALGKLVNDQADVWDQYIPGILFAYHTSIHASTKCTPFKVMYARTAKLPIDLKSADESDAAPLPDSASPDVQQTLHIIRKDLCSAVSSNIASAQSRQKENYDRHHESNKEIITGSIVYIKNCRRIHRMGSKLEPRWTGPYTVVESLSKGRIKLENVKTDKILSNTYHASNLKIYTDATSTSDVPHDLEHSTIPDRPCDTIEDKPQQPKRPRRELDETSDTTEYVSKKPKSTSMFSPLSSNARKNLAVALCLTSTKSIYFGRPSELSQPRRTCKTKGDGNCYRIRGKPWHHPRSSRAAHEH
ncbi:pol Retrovirus-related Pol polyprotein from transposon-like 9, partial [Homarus americanus]